MASQTRGSRRVKVERGQNWIVRFLPARLGPDELWFARIARHWMNKLPIVCPRNTAEDFGGDPDCECPVCVVADELNDSPDDVISKFGYKAKANPQYLTYCIVWEKDGIEQPMSEILNPYEFWLYRSTFEELKGFYVAAARKCPESVLDYERGNDFSVNRTGKGLRLDKQDASPIFDSKNAKYAEWIKKLEAAMKSPKLTIPTHEQLVMFAQKLQAAADRGGHAGDDDDGPRRRPVRGYRDDDDESQFRRGRGRPAPEDDDDLPYDDAPPARPAARAAASARRPAPEPDDSGEPTEEPAPRRRTAPVDDESPRRRSDPVEDEPRPRRQREEAEDDRPRRRREPDPEPQDEPPRRSSRRSEPEVEDAGDQTSAEPEDVEPPQDEPREHRRLAPTARRARGDEAPARAPQGDAEEDDPLPDDDTDTVPPAEKAGDEGDAPTPVSRRGSQGDDIKERLRKMGRNA